MNTSGRNRGLLQLAVFLAVAIGLPALIPYVNTRKKNPSARDGVSVPEQIERLEKEKPSIVIIGDSMVPCRVDGEILGRELGRPVSLLAFNGSASAAWFLLFKNVVCAMEKPPATVVFFFRDTYFHLPRYRTTGQRVALLDDLRLGAEPVLESVLSGAPVGSNPILVAADDALDAMWRVDGYRSRASEMLMETAMGWSKNGLTENQFRAYMEAVFSLRNLRGDLAGDAPEMDEKLAYNELPPPEWSMAPTASFLPHIEQLAAQKNIRLVFYRVKQRGHTMSDWRESEASLAYLGHFKTWAAAQGHGFADESADPEIRFEHFADGDHTREEDRAFVSTRVAAGLRAALRE